MANKEGRQLVKEAVQDAKSLKEAALERAKNELVATLAPGVKKLLERTLSAALESSDRSNEQGSDYYAPATREKQKRWEESNEKGEHEMDKKDEKDLDMESISAFFPGLSEMEGEEEMQDADEARKHKGEEESEEGEEGEEALESAGIPTLGEGEEEEEDEMDEDVEISEAELRKAYESLLKTEVTVVKGFKDMTKAGELDEVDPGAGIADVKKGASDWDKVEPPAKENHIPESLSRLVKAGLAENKALRKALAERTAQLKGALKQMHEVNLFNGKVLHVNKLMNSLRLSKEQKLIAIESLDKARSIGEVKTVYEALSKSFGATQLAESKSARKPVANAQRARTSGAPNEKVLRESADRAQDAGNGRWKKLAGLVK